MYSEVSFLAHEEPPPYRDGEMQQTNLNYIISKNYINLWAGIPLIFHSTPFEDFPLKVFFCCEQEKSS